MTIAHIRSGQILKRFNSEKGWLELEDGRKVSPPVEGFVDGNDKVVPVVTETTDTSTGPDTVSTSATTVETDRVLIAVNIRDKTPAEIDAEQTSDIQNIQRAIRSVTYELACHTRAQWAEIGLNQAQINQRVNAIKASWSEADFVQWVKANLL